MSGLIMHEYTTHERTVKIHPIHPTSTNACIKPLRPMGILKDGKQDS